jgi:hypothetical protein
MSALKLNQEEMASYRAAVRRQAEQEQQALAQREQMAWELAQRPSEETDLYLDAAALIKYGKGHKQWQCT